MAAIGRFAATARARDKSLGAAVDHRAVAERREQRTQVARLDAGNRCEPLIGRERTLAGKASRCGGKPLHSIRAQRETVGDEKAERPVKGRR